jgi:hypothetical protein
MIHRIHIQILRDQEKRPPEIVEDDVFSTRPKVGNEAEDPLLGIASLVSSSRCPTCQTKSQLKHD